MVGATLFPLFVGFLFVCDDNLSLISDEDRDEGNDYNNCPLQVSWKVSDSGMQCF